MVGFVGVSVVHVAAHHAVSSAFDERRTVTVEGVVLRIVDRNPHPLVDLVVENGVGWKRTWSVEFGAASHLRRSAEPVELRPGDQIAVCGNPGRDAGQYRLRMLTLERRSDGYLLTNRIGLLGARCDR